MASNNITMIVTCGGGADLAITREKTIIMRQEYAPGLSCTVQLGKLTKSRIEQLKSNLDRLKVHAAE